MGVGDAHDLPRRLPSTDINAHPRNRRCADWFLFRNGETALQLLGEVASLPRDVHVLAAHVTVGSNLTVDGAAEVKAAIMSIRDARYIIRKEVMKQLI